MPRRRALGRDLGRIRALFERVIVAGSVPALASACVPSRSSAPPAPADAAVIDATVEISKDSGLSGECAPRRILVDGEAPDGGAECSVFYEFPCGVPEASTSRGASCQFHAADCIDVLCAQEPILFACEGYGSWCLDGGEIAASDGEAGAGDAQPVDAGPVVIECEICGAGSGRRPAGLERAAPPARGTGAIGAYFALAASLEAASVIAFRTLGRELRAHRAPAALVREARRAARDEVRHARSTARIARAHGGVPPERAVPPATSRTLEAIAIENVAEGCVRETFGALAASWQACHAEDPAIARAMRAIAADETRHAALAWATARWARTRLHPRARARVDAAFDEAIAALLAELAHEPHPALRKRAGVPGLSVQRRMVAAIAEELRAPRATERPRP